MKPWIVVLAIVVTGCKGATLTAATPKGPTLLLQRVQANDLAYVLDLKPGDPELEMTSPFQTKPLIAALHMRQMDMVKALLDKGASIKPEENQTDPMEAAIRTKDAEIVKLILNRGARTSRIGFGYFPIHIAAQVGSVEIIKLLLRNHADPNEISPTNGETPLDFAVQQGHLEAARALIKAGAKPEVSQMSTGYLGQGVVEALHLKTIDRIFDQQQFLRDHPQLRPKH